jgi:hypothetical protein
MARAIVCCVSHSRDSLNRSSHGSCGPLACGLKVRTFERAGKNCVILFVVYRHACVAQRVSGPIANLPFHHPTGNIGSGLLSLSLSLYICKQSCLRVACNTSLSPQTPPSTVTNLPSLHPPLETTNGPPPPPRLSHASDGNDADNNANDLLHLHHHTPLHHRVETIDPIPLRLDLPLPRPPLHSLPRPAGGKMQFASPPTRSFSGGQKTREGAGVVVLCRSGGRRSRRGRQWQCRRRWRPARREAAAP